MICYFINAHFLNLSYYDFRKYLVNLNCYVGFSSKRFISVYYNNLLSDFKSNHDVIVLPNCMYVDRINNPECFRKGYIILWEESSDNQIVKKTFYITYLRINQPAQHYEIVFDETDTKSRFRLISRATYVDYYLYKIWNFNKTFTTIKSILKCISCDRYGSMNIYTFTNNHDQCICRDLLFFNKVMLMYNNCNNIHKINTICSPLSLSVLCTNVIDSFFRMTRMI